MVNKMGVGHRLIPRRHKLRDDVKDRADRKIGDKFKPAKVLADSPGAFNVVRGAQRRQNSNFAKDSLDRKKDLAWYRTVAIARYDFDTGAGEDYGIKITFPATTETVGEGLRAGDEIKILGKASALSGKRYAVTTQTVNNTDVNTGYARKVSSTIVRLPDSVGFVSETSTRVRVVAGAGVRIKSEIKNAEGKSFNNHVYVRETVTKVSA
jgi:hypothetical protein